MSAAVKPDAENTPTLSRGEVLVDELDGIEFQVHELIGRGGMGEVYRAIRRSDGARCAVKCVRRDLVQNQTILLRTRFEAKAFRKISHPNVVRVHGTGVRSDSVPWMSMEWLEGFTIAEIIEQRGRIPLRWAVEIVRDLCRGLRAIHEYAIHRDIKPSNVHFGLDSVTRALDLGAAKSKEANVHLTSTGFQVGTLPFMAPEQLDNTMRIDHRADLWAATVLLYMLMTGVHPFAVNGNLPQNKIKLGWSILTDPHRPLLSVMPSAPPFFGQIIDRGLAKDPEDRHRSAEELAQVLTGALDLLEAQTGHAEPLSSLVNDLRGDGTPIVAEPPRLLWIAPRGTEPAASPVPRAAPEMSAPEPPPAPATTQEVSTLEASGRIDGLSTVPEPSSAEDEAVEHRRSDVQEKAPLPTPWSRSARSLSRATSVFGVPRWLVVMMCASSALMTGEGVYFLGPSRSAEAPPKPIAAPVVSTPAPADKPEPTPEPTTTTTAAPRSSAAAPDAPAPVATVASTATAAPGALPRPTANPRLQRPAPPPPTVPPPAPAPTQPLFLLFGDEDTAASGAPPHPTAAPQPRRPTPSPSTVPAPAPTQPPIRLFGDEG